MTKFRNKADILTEKKGGEKLEYEEISFKIESILDKGSGKLLKVKELIANQEIINFYRNPFEQQISKIIEKSVKGIMAILKENDIKITPEILDFFRNHPFYDLSIGSSDSATHAYTKPAGYAGDGELMVKSCLKQNNISSDTYSRLVNLSFQNFPSSESTRQRAKSIFETLKNMPEGSKILNLACGPALEIQGLLQATDKNMDIILLDNDKNTLDRLKELSMGERVKIMEANAFKINSTRLRTICDDQKLDLAYSSGLFDYIPDKFAPRIIRAMFDQLKVGGKLIIGNYLALSDTNPHPKRQKFVMDEILDWPLIYRTPEEIEKFLSGIKADTYTHYIGNEYFGTNPNCPAGSIGFLVVKKTK